MFEKAIEICKAVARLKGEAYFVGGYVRDKHMGRDSKDIDIEVFNLSQEKLEGILAHFGEVKLVGKSYGIYKIDDLDISLPRRERKIGKGHSAFDVEVDPLMSTLEASQRRDFTINALMWDPLRDITVDEHNGLYDIDIRRLHFVREKTFVEDPLRALRAARFSSTLGFRPTQTLIDVCGAMYDEVMALPKERVFGEVKRVLMEARYPSVFFSLLNTMGLLNGLLPELTALIQVDQGNTHHTEGNAFIHSLLAIDAIPFEERELDIMLATLFHDLGKPLCRTEDHKGVHFYEHHTLGVPLYYSAMERLTDETVLTQSVVNLARHHMDVWPLIEHCKKKTIRKLAAKTDIYKLLVVHKGDRLGRGTPASIDHIERIISVYEEIKDEIKPLVLGRHLIELGAKPGKYFSGILNEIWEAQLDGKFSTLEEGIAYARTKI